MSNTIPIQKNSLIMVGIDQIAYDPAGMFRMSYGFDNSKLRSSISQVGIINNPCVFRNNEGAVEIVTGFRRILALKDLGVKEVKCFDLTDSEMSPCDMLEFALYDNLFAREFNPVEKSIILNRLTSLTKEKTSINEFISLINVNIKDYELILKIESMDESIKRSISTGVLNIKTLESLDQIKVDSQLILISWINNLKLNYNQQILFVDYVRDITRIEKISIQKLLTDKFYINLLADNKKNIPQKAKELIDALRKRRNPNYSKYQHIFEKKIRQLQLSQNTRIKHPRYFESEFYQLEIYFKDGNELKKSLKELIDKDELENIGDPWFKE